MNLKKTFTFRLHNHWEAEEIRNQLRANGYPENLIESMTEEIYGKFHEVEFSITFNNQGKISNTDLVKL